MHNINDNIFTDNDMIRWRNAFTKNVYNISDNTFNNSVTGANTVVLKDNPVDLPLNHFIERIGTYMPFYKFDDEANEYPYVYNIIMNWIIMYRNDIIDARLAGVDLMGISNVVIAQWDKECPDMELHNRDLVYDQDFYAKNNLIIDPSINNIFDPVNQNNSFADPVIIDKTFTIESGVTSNMSAANKLVFKHGFKAESGSHFHAFTDPSLCMNNKSMAAVTPDEIPDDAPNYQKPEIKSKPVVEVNEQTKFSIYPNPGKGLFTISLSDFEDKNMILVISNTYGQQITQLPLKLLPTQQIDLSYFTPGIYYLSLINNTEVENEIIVIQ